MSTQSQRATGPAASGERGGGRDRIDPLGGDGPNWLTRILRRYFNPSAGTIAGAIVAAMVLGAVIVALFDEDVIAAAGYFFARPGDFFSAFGSAFGSFFTAFIRGSIFDWTQDSTTQAIRPIMETLTRSVPLIIAGLAIAVSFTSGLFNIGVQGQLIIGATVAGFIGFHFQMPVVVHVLVAVLGAILGGALWGLIPGLLKSRLNANEVIVTIMLNSVALFLLQYLLTTRTFMGEGGYPGKSQKIAATAGLPKLFGSDFRLHWGLVIAILAAVAVWWLLKRSTFGFEIRAAGANPRAARTAGVNVPRTLMLTLVISGALAGLAGTAPVLGTEKVITNGVAGSLGFDAITVALLGKNSPLGVVLAGLLFGALNAGGALMQSSAGIPVDIVQITQAIIVLLIAASESIRYRRERRAVAARSASATVTEGAAA